MASYPPVHCADYDPTSYAVLSFLDRLIDWCLLGFLPCYLTSTLAFLLGSRHSTIYVVLDANIRAWSGWGPSDFRSMFISTIIFLLVPFWIRENRWLTQPKDKSSSHSHENPSQNPLKDDLEHLSNNKDEADLEKTPSDLTFFKPLLYPSRTTHRRLYPKTHVFNYSYLLVGVPVLPRPTNVNGMVSVHPSPSPDQDVTNGTDRSWFSVHSSDYLQRGLAFDNLSLRAKLDLYLTAQNVSDPKNTYPYAYLVTAPRFLGFSFNPVSFWYLYDKNEQLAAMILEVNNTFDERRMYFLQRAHDSTRYTDDAGETKTTDGPANLPTKRFTNKWKKDFHVSPFNDRDGSYLVNAVDVLRTGDVDVTIVLSENNDVDHSEPTETFTTPTQASSDSTQNSKPNTSNTTKLIARIYSSTNRDPTTFSSLQRLIFLLHHGYIGFLTNPRILIEARKLWWNKGLTVFYRPEPFNTTIPRVETKQEVIVEESFREVLDSAGRLKGIEIEYLGTAGVERGVTAKLGQSAQRENGQGYEKSDVKGRSSCLKINVLTPAFYSELVLADGNNETLESLFDRLCFNAKAREKMVDCSSAEILHAILADTPSAEGGNNLSAATEKCSRLRSFTAWILQASVNRLRLSRSNGLLSLLRSPPHENPTSTFDKHVRMISTADQYIAYLRAVFILLLADRLALGSVALLNFELRLLRLPLVLFTVTTVMRSVYHFFQYRHGPVTDLP